jgi:glutaredoxin
MLGMRCAILVILAVASSTAAAQIYRWTDQNGKVHISDTPPPPGAKNVQKRPATAAQPSEPDAQQGKKSTVTLFSTPACGESCSSARQLLNTRGVPFREVSVVDENSMEELMKMVGADAVPSLVVGSAVQQGFRVSAYHAMLDAAGFPQTGVLPPRSQQAPKPAAEPATAKAEEERASGPYAPGASPQRQRKK